MILIDLDLWSVALGLTTLGGGSANKRTNHGGVDFNNVHFYRLLMMVIEVFSLEW